VNCSDQRNTTRAAGNPQSTGIAGQLSDFAKARAFELGYRQVCLDVAADNAAVGFYQHLGFRTQVETRLPALDAQHGIGLHLHMVHDLAQTR
jgi:GNAT superfamily N-acetyltransferase